MNRIDPPLFAYGTLRDREILEGVLGRAVVSAHLLKARVFGWRTVYYPNRLYPALVRADEWTKGCLISGLDRPDIARLDGFEGSEYRRDTIEVTTEDGTLMAQTYFATREIGPDAPRWSFETWARLHRPATIARYRSENFQ
jgi:gamma-glutamylcyclotransferase (GGCT)/AIG2-like uncharacterized protein YtfP